MKYTDEYLAKAGKLTTMGDLNNRIAKLEEKTPTKPINLSELEARITNLEGRLAKIITINKSGTNLYPIPTEHVGKNFVIMSASADISLKNDSRTTLGTSVTNGTSLQIKLVGKNIISVDTTFSFTISGTNIVCNARGFNTDTWMAHCPASITVLF